MEHDASDGRDEYRAEAMKDHANEAARAATEAGMEIRAGMAQMTTEQKHLMDVRENERIGFKLIHAVTEYDRREEQRAMSACAKGKAGYHNIWALSQYIAAVNNALTYATPRGEFGPFGAVSRGTFGKVRLV